MKNCEHLISVGIVGIFILMAGCASTPPEYRASAGRVDSTLTHNQFDSSGFAVGEVLEVVSYMMPRMMANPFVMRAVENGKVDFSKVPRVVVLPVKNNTRFTLNKGIFMNRFRSELNKQAMGKMLFLARENMPELEAEMELKGKTTITTADFFLTGTIDGLTSHGASGGNKESYLYSFRMIDVNTQAIIWEDNYTISKVAVERLINR